MSTEPMNQPQPTAIPRAPKGYANVVVAGVLFERLTIRSAAHNGRCHRSGALFSAGATIGYKDRETLTPEQRAAVFGDKQPKHLTVLLTPDEINPPLQPPVVLPEPAEVVRCHPDPARMRPFQDLVEHNEYPSGRERDAGEDPNDDWGMGNVSTRAVVYSCGHLARADKPLDHRHDPAELALCERLARDAASRLTQLRMGEGEPIRPFFATAVVGEPVREWLDARAVRWAFGGTLSDGIDIHVERMERRGGKWDQMDGVAIDLDTLPAGIEAVEQIIAHQQTVWNVEWVRGLVRGRARPSRAQPGRHRLQRRRPRSVEAAVAARTHRGREPGWAHQLRHPGLIQTRSEVDWLESLSSLLGLPHVTGDTWCRRPSRLVRQPSPCTPSLTVILPLRDDRSDQDSRRGPLENISGMLAAYLVADQEAAA